MRVENGVVIWVQWFGIARASQDLSIRNTEFLTAEACQMSHLGQNRVEQSYKTER